MAAKKTTKPAAKSCLVTQAYTVQGRDGKWEHRDRQVRITVGDTVGFKYDVEQCGKVLDIRRSEWGTGYECKVLATEGGYVCGTGCEIWVAAEQCWKVG